MRAVFKLLAEGKTSREIARYLAISVKTAMTHRSNIMTKLNVHSRVELTKYAIRNPGARRAERWSPRHP